jgi:hypothetical protein
MNDRYDEAEKALRLLIQRCEEVIATLHDADAMGYDGATTRAMWRVAVLDAQIAVNKLRG